MSKILKAISKIDNADDMRKFISWMKENDVDNGYIRTAHMKLQFLDPSPDPRKSHGTDTE